VGEDEILREWIEVAAFAAEQSFLTLVTSILLRIENKTHHASGEKYLV
jgi:hypothetical protein